MLIIHRQLAGNLNFILFPAVRGSREAWVLLDFPIRTIRTFPSLSCRPWLVLGSLSTYWLPSWPGLGSWWWGFTPQASQSWWSVGCEIYSTAMWPGWQLWSRTAGLPGSSSEGGVEAGSSPPCSCQGLRRRSPVRFIISDGGETNSESLSSPLSS